MVCAVAPGGKTCERKDGRRCPKRPSYAGGLDGYRVKCEEEAANDYEGLTLSV